jgi:hypothetical protein
LLHGGCRDHEIENRGDGACAAHLYSAAHPKDPLGEWCSGIEDGELFYPLFPHAARGSEGCSSAALKANPRVAIELRQLIMCCGFSVCRRP